MRCEFFFLLFHFNFLLAPIARVLFLCAQWADGTRNPWLLNEFNFIDLAGESNKNTSKEIDVGKMFRRAWKSFNDPWRLVRCVHTHIDSSLQTRFAAHIEHMLIEESVFSLTGRCTLNLNKVGILYRFSTSTQPLWCKQNPNGYHFCPNLQGPPAWHAWLLVTCILLGMEHHHM